MGEGLEGKVVAGTQLHGYTSQTDQTFYVQWSGKRIGFHSIVIKETSQ